MTYWADYEYNERYYVRFCDIEGVEWRISIQDPTDEWQAIELLGGEFPVQWMGVGDESQTDVVLGSTGTLRLICRQSDIQNSIFSHGALMPVSINDRRVQILRNMGTAANPNFEVYWQGFIKPDIISQEWDRAPYEIELPIVSVVAAMEFFTMPDSIVGTEFNGVTNIAGLLRAICIHSGCDIRNIFTNKPVYEDFNGEKHINPGVTPTQYVHWTQGVVSSSYFYDISDGIMKPKTFKDVLENICYPYGKVHDVYRGIAVVMRTADDAEYHSEWSSLPIYSDYANRTPSTATRFGFDSYIKYINLSEIQTAGTDNKYTVIPAPRSVTFSKNINTSKEIFELTDKFIKPSLPIGSTIVGNSLIEDSRELLNGVRRYVYAIHRNYVNKEFANDWTFTNTQSSALSDYPFCRVAEVTGDDNENTTSITVPLGLCFNISSDNISTEKIAKTEFRLVNGVRTSYEMNAIKLTIKPFVFETKDPSYEKSISTHSGTTYIKMDFYIKDVNVNKYLNYVYVQEEGKYKWVWQNGEAYIDFSWLVESSSEYVLLFNEYRESGDNALHTLQLGFRGRTNYSLQVTESGSTYTYTYGRMFVSFNLEYAEYPRATNQSIAAKFAESIEKNGNSIEYGGSGEELNISFETLCGTLNNVINGSIMLPYNSFCNSQTYIDTQNREKIEIEAAKFVRYDNAFDIVTSYLVVKDGSKVYVPVAVGMNPRMNTVNLRLISTNVTSS